MEVDAKFGAFAAQSAAQDQLLAKARVGPADIKSGTLDEQTAAKVRKAAEDFESIFLEIVMKSMRDSVQKSGLIDGGNAEDIYRSMLDSEYSKVLAAQRNTGLSANIEAQLLTALGKQSVPSAAVVGQYQKVAGARPVPLAPEPLRVPDKQATMNGLGSELKPAQPK